MINLIKSLRKTYINKMMNNKNNFEEFNVEKFLSLKQKAFELRRKNQFLPKEEADELTQYSSMLADHVHATKNQEFFILLENFILGKITSDDFSEQFYQVWKSSREQISSFKSNDLKLIKFDSKFKDFSISINNIITYCDLFDNSEDIDDIQNEKEFRELINYEYQKLLTYQEKDK